MKVAYFVELVHQEPTESILSLLHQESGVPKHFLAVRLAFYSGKISWTSMMTSGGCSVLGEYVDFLIATSPDLWSLLTESHIKAFSGRLPLMSTN